MYWIICIIIFVIGYIMGIITVIYDKDEREKQRVIKMERIVDKLNNKYNKR